MIIQPSGYCGLCRNCRLGLTHYCDRAYTTGGDGPEDVRPGSFAEYTLTGANTLFPKPPGVSFEAACQTEPVSGAWKVVAHFDPPTSAPRLTQDHDPIGNRCPTSQWQRGDYIVDKFTVDSSKASTDGSHAVYVGFWPGGNRERMKVTSAPNGTIDADRVRIASVLLQ